MKLENSEHLLSNTKLIKTICAIKQFSQTRFKDVLQQSKSATKKSCGCWMDGWIEGKAILRFSCNNKKKHYLLSWWEVPISMDGIMELIEIAVNLKLAQTS